MKKLACLLLAISVVLAMTGCCCAPSNNLTANPFQALIYRFFGGSESNAPVSETPYPGEDTTYDIHNGEEETGYYSPEEVETTGYAFYANVPGSMDLHAVDTVAMTYSELVNLAWDFYEINNYDEYDAWTLTGTINNVKFAYAFHCDVSEDATCTYLTVYSEYEDQSAYISDGVLLGDSSFFVTYNELLPMDGGYYTEENIGGYYTQFVYSEEGDLIMVQFEA